MSKKYSGHSLVSDITPWWWSSHWDDAAMKLAVNEVLTTTTLDISRIDISREGLQLKLALGEQEDVNRTQDLVDALKDALDEMVAT